MATSSSSLSLQSLKRPRSWTSQNNEDEKEEEENYESKTKQQFAPSRSAVGALLADSRWRCVPGILTRECVEYKIGEDVNEQKRFANPSNRGIYTDYPSRTSCEAMCTTLPTDPLNLAMSMLNAGDIRNLVRVTQNFPQIASELKDTFKEAKEAQSLERDIVNLFAVANSTDLNFKTLFELAQRTFVDRIELGEGRLFSQRVSHFLVSTVDFNRSSDRFYPLLDFLVKAMLSIPGWIISNPDRLHLFIKSTPFRKPYQENWLKLGLLNTLNLDDPRDQKLVLRNILSINDDQQLIWTIEHLLPYFVKYDFSKDPILVGYLWAEMPWIFVYGLQFPSDRVAELKLTASLWQLLDQLHILLIEGIDAPLISSPIFNNATWYNEEEKKYTVGQPVNTENAVSNFITLLQSLTPEQLIEHAEIIQLAIETLLRQPYFAPRVAELRPLLNLYATPPLQLQ